MTRTDLLKRMAENTTRPLEEFMHQPVEAAAPEQEHAADATEPRVTDLFIWFEDTSTRKPRDGLRGGIAGLPESLLPCARGMRVVERRYVEDHMHLLCAVHLKCRGDAAERIAALYTAALSVGTVAWVGTGLQYQRAWQDMYAARAALPRPTAG